VAEADAHDQLIEGHEDVGGRPEYLAVRDGLRQCADTGKDLGVGEAGVVRADQLGGR
jgi:hypothetical protein